jgi:hypothetical protein
LLGLAVPAEQLELVVQTELVVVERAEVAVPIEAVVALVTDSQTD